MSFRKRYIQCCHSNILLPCFRQKCGRCAVDSFVVITCDSIITLYHSDIEVCFKRQRNVKTKITNAKGDGFVVLLSEQLLKHDENTFDASIHPIWKWAIKDDRDCIDPPNCPVSLQSKWIIGLRYFSSQSIHVFPAVTC